MAKHNHIGKEGEQLAIATLLSKGWIILEKNWRWGKYEIDIIADNGEELVFIEVKTRSSDRYGTPEEAVDEEKELQMINAAEVYLNYIDVDVEVRFDIIAIILNDNESRINHIENAFVDTFLN